MPSRRSILQSAAVISAAPLAPGVVFADIASQAAHIGVVCDSRHPESRAFASRAGDLGVPTRTIAGDITGLWQTELRARWKEAPAAIAGLTERPALFLLEQLAWDYGLRVVFQAEHESNGRGSAVHRVLRSAHPDLEHDLEAAGPMWPAALAERILSVSRDVASKDFTPSGAAMASRLDEPTMLYSWIIAPRSAA